MALSLQQKSANDGNYSIISDYQGTPLEAYDEQGHKVWSAELDVYERVKEFTGEKDFILFRYQGQYEDIEIGLKQYHDVLQELINDLRQDLRKGKIRLHCEGGFL